MLSLRGQWRVDNLGLPKHAYRFENIDTVGRAQDSNRSKSIPQICYTRIVIHFSGVIQNCLVGLVNDLIKTYSGVGVTRLDLHKVVLRKDSNRLRCNTCSLKVSDYYCRLNSLNNNMIFHN